MGNRRDRRKGAKYVCLVTNRLCCGLPFVCKPYMDAIIKGAMAMAYAKYPAQVCHYLWMGNHFHMLLAGRVKFISGFIGCFEGEIAKCVKRMTLLYQTKVWAGEFKEQWLCTAQDTFRKIGYIYANPARADMVDKIDDYPGVSSWKMFIDKDYSFKATYIAPSTVSKVGYCLGEKASTQLCDEYLKNNDEVYEFKINPHAWKKAFPETKHMSNDELDKKVIEFVRGHEDEARNRRKKPVMGAEKLKRQCMHREYIPESWSPTPFLICHDVALRCKCIKSYKRFCKKCKKAWQRWKLGFVKARYPKGAYRPYMPLVHRVNLAKVK